MKRSCRALSFLAVLLALAPFSAAQASSTDNHTGFYIYAMGGFMKLSDDTNIHTNLKFGHDYEPAFGLTFGDNIANYIAPEIQFSYSTSTGNTASGPAREHALTIRLNAKYSFFTASQASKPGWKVLPYLKAGGIVHGLFVNAPADIDKVGSFGGGFDLGGGLEVNKGVLYLGVDVSNDFVFLQSETKTIAGIPTKILKGGFDDQISAMGAVGVHF